MVGRRVLVDSGRWKPESRDTVNGATSEETAASPVDGEPGNEHDGNVTDTLMSDPEESGSV